MTTKQRRHKWTVKEWTFKEYKARERVIKAAKRWEADAGLPSEQLSKAVDALLKLEGKRG